MKEAKGAADKRAARERVSLLAPSIAASARGACADAMTLLLSSMQFVLSVGPDHTCSSVVIFIDETSYGASFSSARLALTFASLDDCL